MWRQLGFTAVFDSARHALSHRPTVVFLSSALKHCRLAVSLLMMSSLVLDSRVMNQPPLGSEGEGPLFRCQHPLAAEPDLELKPSEFVDSLEI